jgi:hypothetical protein
MHFPYTFNDVTVVYPQANTDECHVKGFGYWCDFLHTQETFWVVLILTSYLLGESLGLWNQMTLIT